MPEIVACPECGRKLRVPDEFLGKKVKCPQCSKQFVAETEGGKDPDAREEKRPARDSGRVADRPARRRDEDEDDDRGRSRKGRDDEDEDRPRSRRRDEDDDDDRSRSRRRDDDDDDRSRGRGRDRDDVDEDDDDDRGGRSKSNSQKSGWRMVAMGLLLMAISAMTFLAILVSFWVGFWLAARLESLTMIQMTTWLMFILAFTGLAVNQIGVGLNVGVPSKEPYATKGLAIATCATTGFAWLAVSVILLMFFSVFVALMTGDFRGGFAGGGGGFGPRQRGDAESTAVLLGGMICLGGIAFIASFFLGCFTLRSIAVRVKRNDLASSVIAYMISHSCFYVAIIILQFLIAAVLQNSLARGRMDLDTATLMGWCMFAYGLVINLINVALFVWYVVILFQLRGAVSYYIRKKL